MDEHKDKFLTEGLAAIAAAVLMPVAFILGGIEDFVFDTIRAYPGIGIADFLLLAAGAVYIYVLVGLKKLLFERYSFRGVNVIIGIMIFWTIVNYGGSFVLELIGTVAGRGGYDVVLAIQYTFWISCIAVFGILDIILGIMLLRQMRRFGTALKVFAVLSIATGFFGATVLLAIVNLVLFPLALVVLAVAFLKREEAVEFV